MEYIDPFRIYTGASGKKVVFDPPPNKAKAIVKFNINYAPRLVQTVPSFSIPAQNAGRRFVMESIPAQNSGRRFVMESIPEVFLPTFVAMLLETTFFEDIKQTSWYINNCVVNIIRIGDLDKLKLSVKTGLHVDHIIRSGKTSLTIAVLAQKPEILTWLLSKGANPNIVDDKGYTCLEYATSFNNAEILKCLFLCKNISAITKRRACFLIKHARLNPKPQHVEVIKSLAYYSLGLSAEEHRRFVYYLENKGGVG